MYSKFGHCLHPLDYLCAKFRFFRGIHCWASPRRKIAYSINHSVTHWLTQLIYCARNRSFCFGRNCRLSKNCDKNERAVGQTSTGYDSVAVLTLPTSLHVVCLSLTSSLSLTGATGIVTLIGVVMVMDGLVTLVGVDMAIGVVMVIGSVVMEIGVVMVIGGVVMVIGVVMFTLLFGVVIVTGVVMVTLLAELSVFLASRRSRDVRTAEKVSDDVVDNVIETLPRVLGRPALRNVLRTADSVAQSVPSSPAALSLNSTSPSLSRPELGLTSALTVSPYFVFCAEITGWSVADRTATTLIGTWRTVNRRTIWPCPSDATSTPFTWHNTSQPVDIDISSHRPTASCNQRSYFTLGPVSTGMGDQSAVQCRKAISVYNQPLRST